MSSSPSDAWPVPAVDVVGDYVNAEAAWHDAAADISLLAAAQVTAAREYVQAIDAYVAVLRASGRQIPHHMDALADKLRVAYNDNPLPRVA